MSNENEYTAANIDATATQYLDHGQSESQNPKQVNFDSVTKTDEFGSRE